LARYLSNDWLATTQIDQQLELLRWRIHRQCLAARKHEIVNTHFFPKIIELFHRSHSTYSAESPPSGGCYPWAIGQDLADAASEASIVSGVFNVLNSHWVAMSVDAERRTISYGDSLDSDRKTKDIAMQAVKWWIAVHMKDADDFVHVDLPVSRQTDSFSCGVFAVNSIQHLIFPQDALFLPHKAVTECYCWFLAALAQQNELVCSLLCSLCPTDTTPSNRPMMN